MEVGASCALLVLGSSVPFFAAAAGRNFVWFSLVTAVPAVLWLCCAWHDHRRPHCPEEQRNPGQADEMAGLS